MLKSEEIRLVLAKLQEDKDAVTAQLAEARRYNAATGDYRDADWYQRAENASRHIGRKIAKAQAELGAALREERGRQENSFEKLFVQVSRQVLPRPLYEQILQETLDAVKKKEPGPC